MRKVKARKDHQCHTCGNPIKKGEQYYIDDSYYAKFFAGNIYRWCCKCAESFGSSNT